MKKKISVYGPAAAEEEAKQLSEERSGHGGIQNLVFVLSVWETPAVLSDTAEDRDMMFTLLVFVLPARCASRRQCWTFNPDIFQSWLSLNCPIKLSHHQVFQKKSVSELHQLNTHHIWVDFPNFRKLRTLSRNILIKYE